MQKTLQSLIPALVVAGLSFASGAFANDCVDCGAPSTTTSTTTVDVQKNESTSTAIAAPTLNSASYNLNNPTTGSNVNYNVTQGSQGSFSRNNPVGNNTSGLAFQSSLGCVPVSYGAVTENLAGGLDLGYLGGISLNIPATKLAGGVQGADKNMLVAMENANRAQSLSLSLVEAALSGNTSPALQRGLEAYIATQTRCNVTNVNNVTNVVEQQPQVQEERLPPSLNTPPTPPRG